MRTLTLAPSVDRPEKAEGPDSRDFPLRIALGARPLDLLPACRFGGVLDDQLLLDLTATTDPGGRVVPIRPEESCRTIKARTFFIGRSLTTDQLSVAIRDHGGRNATPVEGLAFAAQHPDVQRQSPIVLLDWSRPEGRWTKYAMLTVDPVGKRILRSVCRPNWPSAWRYLIIVP